MLWPQVPEDIKSLSATEAKAFAREIKAAAVTALRSGEVDRAEVDEKLELRDALLAHADAQDTAAKLESDDSDAADPEPEPEVEAEVEEEEEADEDLSAKPLPTSFGAPAIPAALPVKADPRPIVRTAPEYLFAASGIQGKDPGDSFDSWSEVAAAAAYRGKSLNATSTERFEIARIRGNYTEDRILGEDVLLNAAKFETEELVATFCPPATPHYNLACANTLRRPVFASLPGFQAPRGSVTVMSSPALSDITTGFGQWTSDDDLDADAVKDACQTITCGTPTTFEMYGVYRCLTVKNMMAMVYPELVEAYLNRLGAAQARLAEELMLNAMATGTTDISAPKLGYGGSVTVTSTILNYLALYQETQRWDITDNMKAWAPRWLLWAMKMDIVRRRNTTGTINVPTDAQIEQMFRNVGVDITWFIDRPTWAVAISAVSTASTLNRLPDSVDILIAPPGKFAAIDRGELAIGVTGNNLYRDNESNRRNQFTFFFENFEGVVNTTSCPAHTINIPACWNGVQVDDQLVNCYGADEGGYQS